MKLDQTDLIENVCAKCPATNWGQKSQCQVHGCHVGKVEQCPEWDKFLVSQQGFRDHDGQLAFTDLEPALEILQRTEEEIRDYKYMQVEIIRIQRYLKDAGDGTVAQYGIEAAMPKGKGITGDKTHAEVARRERKWKRLKKLQETIERIHLAAETIKNEQERLVLEALLDGERNNMIAKEIGVSRQRYYEIKRSVITSMTWKMYGKEVS
ncbi:hypothetical protein [Brevibacillus laterosporus]|uniref:hypothetical protein n=1 Tax=Brevibacillus laterosporus TaxID=1465 RepID=UPI000EB4D888|nr:hypothetical protein [Brevibacillus laterosporus]AYK09259.1 hypothetical protein D8Z77_22385 [Brevibacillus laterosporus]